MSFVHKITAVAITLAILASLTACGGNSGTPATTTATTTVGTGVPDGPSETTETTTAPVEEEETFDVDAFLADATVYDVTTDTATDPLKELDKMSDADKPKKIALRFTDAEGLTAYMEQSELGSYFITHLQKNSLDVPLSENDGLYYGNNGVSFSHKSGTTIIEIAGGLHVFSNYHIIKGEEYNLIKNTAAKSGYALYVSMDDSGELTYRKYNEKYHRYSSEEILLAYESDDDFYNENGTLYFENGTAVYEAESSMTIGEYFNSDNFELKAPRDRYGVKSMSELAELYRQYVSEGKQREFMELD